MEELLERLLERLERPVLEQLLERLLGWEGRRKKVEDHPAKDKQEEGEEGDAKSESNSVGSDRGHEEGKEETTIKAGKKKPDPTVSPDLLSDEDAASRNS